MDLNNILTEKRNPNTYQIDQLSSLEILKLIHHEDSKVPNVIEKIIPHIASLADAIVKQMQQDGRFIYVGAGTSGRLGVLDASECPPTFGTLPEDVIGVIAGGEKALQFALEGAEDSVENGKLDMKKIAVNERDVVIGLAASGRTPYTIEAMKEAKRNGAIIGAVVCSPNSEMEQIADYAIVAEVGPEVITGSTRMKAGTAQKFILNMLSTTVMIKLGKVYENLMVDVVPTNKKLHYRAKLIVSEAAGVPLPEAESALNEFKTVKAAILALVTGLKGEQVHVLLEKNHGHLRKAIDDALKKP